MSRRSAHIERHDLSQDEYRRLAEMRHGQRRFLQWSAEQAERAGVTATQHQLLLGIRASQAPGGPTIGEMAEYLILRHHSAVELVNRAERAGLVSRHRDSDQHALVRLTLTDRGAEVLRSLTAIHLRELAELAPTMSALWDEVAELARTSSEITAP